MQTAKQYLVSEILGFTRGTLASLKIPIRLELRVSESKVQKIHCCPMLHHSHAQSRWYLKNAWAGYNIICDMTVSLQNRPSQVLKFPLPNKISQQGCYRKHSSRSQRSTRLGNPASSCMYWYGSSSLFVLPCYSCLYPDFSRKNTPRNNC